MFYVPYWRIRGIVFSCDEELEVKSSIVDATYCGVGVESYPESLGLRPQALRLRFATPESGILFPEPSLMFNQVFERSRQDCTDTNLEMHYSYFINFHR